MIQVIRALYDYNAPTNPPHYLSFAAGDFLHVVGREGDDDWYEACNPLHGTRGLVPVKYFETVGKTVGDSRNSITSAASTPHDSGYADSTGPKSAITGAPPLGHRISKSFGKMGGGAMVYGVVAYDFHAERPDELEAKEGEAIIVIAQSNPEWFVAKPITRLGGPGLIPVSFIEIKDMHTGQTVTDIQEAIQRAGIPKVEEWKKMAADYKNTSIPLGQFSPGTVASPSLGGVTPAMERMSLGAPPNGYSGHSRSPSQLRYSQQSPQILLPHPVRASVPRFLYADDKYHFVVESTLADGSQWDLSRIYEDFYELQINLIKAFPEEAGQTGQTRTLPYMPGPVQFVTDKISEGRRENLDEYLHNLLRLGPHIVRSQLVSGFFSPKGGDYEVDPNAADSNGQVPVQPIQMQPHPAEQRHSQASQRSIPYSVSQASTYQTPQHERQMSSLTQQTARGPGHYRNPSNFSTTSGTVTHPPPMQRQTTAQSQSSSASSAPMKVKVWFDRDTCVVVRMPPKGQFRYSDLHRKVTERRKLEFSNKKDSGVEDESRIDDEQPMEMEYRDERDGEYYQLKDDGQLAHALDSNEKLTLVVRDTRPA